MLKHKSFVMNYGAKQKNKTTKKPTSKPTASEPKIATEAKPEIFVSHYDNNEPITLSLPQSLSMSQELADNDYKIYNRSRETENTNQLLESNQETLNEANTYFKVQDKLEPNPEDDKDQTDRNAYTQSQSKQDVDTLQSEPESPGSETLKEKKQKKLDDKLKLPSTIETLQDKKFEEDIKAIMENKKIAGKYKGQTDPNEALKNKNQGLIDKKGDDKIEEKMKNEHAIFDKIAQSMEMAHSYDFGAITMDNKFDTLEDETDKEFTKKIHTLLSQDIKNEDFKDVRQMSANIDEAEDIATKEVILEAENNIKSIEPIKEKKYLEHPVKENSNDNDKILTKDFLNDLDTVNEIESKSKSASSTDTLSKQSSFNSTISIKHRYLKSRIFGVTGSTVQATINSQWNPMGCSPLTDLNVILTKSINYWPDTDMGTKKFRIGGPDTKTWNELTPGNYYLTFFFVNNTNPNCELTGTISVTT